MSKAFKLNAYWYEGGSEEVKHEYPEIGFYTAIPGVSIRRNHRSNNPKGRLYTLDAALMIDCYATAVVTSGTLAAIIKAWLKSRRTRIAISVGDYSLEYEGPDAKKGLKEIEESINRLVTRAGEDGLYISAMPLPPEPKLPATAHPPALLEGGHTGKESTREEHEPIAGGLGICYESPNCQAGTEIGRPMTKRDCKAVDGKSWRPVSDPNACEPIR